MPLGDVRKTLVDERLDHRDHCVDMLGRTRLDIRPQNPELAHIVVVGLDVLRRDLVDGLAALDRGCVDLVIDVGNVAHKRQLVMTPQDPRQHVEDHGRARVSNVRKVIDGWPAQVHRHLARLLRFERDLPAPQCVV